MALSENTEGSLCPECAEKSKLKKEKLVRAGGKALVATLSIAIVLVTAFPKLKDISATAKKIKKKK